jgi:hypothetical protein
MRHNFETPVTRPATNQNPRRFPIGPSKRQNLQMSQEQTYQ